MDLSSKILTKKEDLLIFSDYKQEWETKLLDWQVFEMPENLLLKILDSLDNLFVFMRSDFYSNNIEALFGEYSKPNRKQKKPSHIDLARCGFGYLGTVGDTDYYAHKELHEGCKNDLWSVEVWSWDDIRRKNFKLIL
jgi:hypothetical protein